MLKVKHRRWVGIFMAVACLVLAQVTWWTTVFIQDVSTIAELREKNLSLQGQPVASRATIQRDAFHRRLMFISESVFFVLLSCFGLYLLYRALKVEERSRETEKNFIEILTHESKTPLTALKLRIESIAETWDQQPDLARDLGLALDEVRRLSSVVEKTLDLNRLERNAYHFETVYLADVAREVAHRLDAFFRIKGVRLSLDLDDEAVVLGDSRGLQNSLQSLLENAVLYNPRETKHVKVSVRQKNPWVTLAVEDDGVGIEPEEQSRIFERFYRGAAGRRVPGTGLGLYIARTIVEAHQGVIRLVSGVGRGSFFEIQLPRCSL